ncbi:MAG: hypothetical protein ACR2KT_16180 [Methylocella sp.]
MLSSGSLSINKLAGIPKQLAKRSCNPLCSDTISSVAFARLGEREARTGSFEEAVAAYREALKKTQPPRTAAPSNRLKYQVSAYPTLLKAADV